MEALTAWLSDLKADFILNFVAEERWKFITTGLKNTLVITFASLILGVLLGVIVAIVRSSYDKTHHEMRKGAKKSLFAVLNGICKIYLTVIRGTPVVVQLMIMYYIIFATSRNSLMVAILAFGINSGAYVAEIVRSGIMSIDEGQFEAGRSLGFDYKRTMLYVIIPQAFKNVLPALANEFIVLLKETSVAGYVTIRDLTMGGNIIRAATYSPFMPLIAVAVIYLVMVMFFTWLVGMLERGLRKSER
ncbi:MAG: amino acid ABC transporter permease [Clostridia bacterium]|nr:amino acid ABC transporter permease [Clostridia bacterium]